MNANEVRLVGNLVKEPQIFEKEDSKFGRMRIAVNTRSKFTDETLFIDVKINSFVMRDIDYFEVDKGDRVLVTGRLVQEEYTATEGHTVKVFVVYADSVMKIATKQSV